MIKQIKQKRNDAYALCVCVHINQITIQSNLYKIMKTNDKKKYAPIN